MKQTGSKLPSRQRRQAAALHKGQGSRLWHWMVAPLAAWLVRLLARTLRLTMIGGEHYEAALRSTRPVILVFWHENLFAITALHLLRNWRRSDGKRVTVMVSRSRDGEKLAGVLRGLGAEPIRGSSSRGAVRGLVELARWLKAGEGSEGAKERARFAALALDGPRGPRHVAKPGAALLARHTGALVLPVSFRFSRQWVFNSWDRTKLAKPWAVMECRFATPLDAATWSAADDAARAERLARTLNALASVS